MKTVIIIPTYNERDNITPLISELRVRYPDFDILIVDDNSPDITYQIVREISKDDSKVKLLLRERKEGLGRALVSGYRYSLSN